MIDERLAGKVAVVSGGLGVAGAALSDLLRARGARVARIDRAPASESAALCGRELIIGDLDLADEAAARAAVARVCEAYGHIDAVFNLAGAFEWRPVSEAEGSLWLSLFTGNLLSAVHLTRAALPQLSAGAIVVNVAAAAAHEAGAGMAPYAAAKSGVLRFTEALASEVAATGVWVGSVSPTIIDTPRNRLDMPHADRSAWLAPSRLAEVLADFFDAAARPPSGGDLRL